MSNGVDFNDMIQGGEAGRKAIEDAIENAKEIPADVLEAVAKSKGKLATPQQQARLLLDSVNMVTDETGTLYLYNGTCFDALSEQTLQSIAYRAFKKPSRAICSELIYSLKAASHVRGLRWGLLRDYEVAFKNGVLDLVSGKIRAHRAEDYLDGVIPHDYVAEARCPVWLATLRQWFLVDGGEIAALQEFFGYCNMSHAHFKKALLVYGESDTGKSIIPFVAAEMVGRDRVGALPLEKMDDHKARAAIVGKQLNILTEVSEGALIADGGFKTMISGEEPMLVDEKYKPPYSYWSRAKHIFVTNNLPGLTDRTEAVLNRLLIVPMTRVFAKTEQDEELQNKLHAEMPGIVAWSAAGAKRLYQQRGRFSEVAGGKVVLSELRRKANPIIDFISEMLMPSETAAVPLQNVADAFNHWKRGTKRVTSYNVGQMLRKALGDGCTKDVRYGARVLKSLLGYELVNERVPDLFAVSAVDAASDATEIPAVEAITIAKPVQV